MKKDGQQFFFIFLIFCLSCNSNKPGNKGSGGQDSDQATINNNVNDKKTGKPGNNNSSQVDGYWRLSEDDFVSMIIKKDSIFYPDQNAVSLFKRYNDALIIFDSAYSNPDTMQYKMNGKDTLIFFVAGDQQVYVRANY